ncbi:dihydrolipoamide dehydrogenase [Pseudopedobacter saltans DSM 12145]|uniref:Dihydrolipoyl dehydrogenase n=1 Tax=Pseudopedobacter saltans (strain ATCC 51119 / DSM 12145 / JCM 21818 / CCUG 39354 / LMG 10337 / NBRC 100064 / NCIMB 13643) TaxID=762903 RepID=F0S5V0_PSESL|nr:dihydrolipoyl dehydrogenase [Pseudopedobacter saltans]ADY51021.1 dihydrolipoamide dehydrogenase [Pseudopedobacter saltans DSM 12145]
MNYDVIVIGSGPGGYVAAIRASQLGLKTAVVEKESLGGICLNWGCIPTKALLKSAQVFEYINHASEYGIQVAGAEADFDAIVKRSRGVADGMSKGIQFLMKKNKIDVINGYGKIKKGGKIEVKAADGSTKEYTAKHTILATGGRSRELPNLKQDGKKIIGYREAMVLPQLPKSMVVVGSGAIGVEFAYFYATMGTKVTVVEFMDNIVPVEDEDVSKQLVRSFKKTGIEVMTKSSVESVDTKGDLCKVNVKTESGNKVLEAEVVLSAVGVVANIENIGLEEVGVKTDKGKVIVDEFYKTNVAGVYAIGDIVPGQALAHVASAEGIICVEKIAGHHPEPLNYNNIPGCTYCSPEIASVGYTEKTAKAAGYDIKVGKFPFSASGKASASGAKDGFVKVIFDAKYGEFLGAHMIGANVTEMIAEVVVARKLETTGMEIVKSVHPHPTMSEAIMEAAADAYGEVIHL